MPYAKLLDDFHSNPKLIELGLEGTGLYARSLSFCGAYLTDGFVPEEWAQATAKRRSRLLKRMVEFGVWEKVKGGYKIPDFLEFNPSKAEFVAAQEQKAKAGKKGAMNRWHGSKRHNTRHDTRDGESHGESDDTSDGKTIAPRAGTRPFPSSKIFTPKVERPPETDGATELDLLELGKTLEQRIGAAPRGTDARLFEVLADFDADSSRVVKPLLEKLPVAAIEYVREEVLAAEEEKRTTGYAVQILKRMVEEQTVEKAS